MKTSKKDLSRDRNLVSEQPWEILHVVAKLAEEFPAEDRKDIRRVVEQSKAAVQPSESREAVMAEARRRLGKN